MTRLPTLAEALTENDQMGETVIKQLSELERKELVIKKYQESNARRSKAAVAINDQADLIDDLQFKIAHKESLIVQYQTDKKMKVKEYCYWAKREVEEAVADRDRARGQVHRAQSDGRYWYEEAKASRAKVRKAKNVDHSRLKELERENEKLRRALKKVNDIVGAK